MKRVGMFVWNHFTNDARVLRECTTLSKNGYDVDLFCIDDPEDNSIEQYEEVNENFRVHRLERYPKLLTGMQKVYKTLRRNKLLLVVAGLIWLLFVYLIPLITIPITVLSALLLKTKVRVVWIRGSMIVRMIIKAHRGNYDIYHSNDLNTLPQGYVAAKWRMKKKKLIYDSHEVQTSRTGYEHPMYKKFEGFFINRMDEMYVENHTRAKYNEDLYGFYPNVLHNYPFKQKVEDKEKVDLHAMLGIDKEEKILLYQGGVQTGRGLDKLVEAFPMFDDGVLVFIGEGRIKEDLIQKVEDLGLSNKIRFLPKVPLKELPKYTRNAYLGFQVLNNVCFNHYSASSNKLFEYMMSEVPVVACDFPEIKNVVIDNEVGLTVDSHNPKEIAEAVNKLLKDEALRNKLSENCIAAREQYNWESEQKHLLAVYNKL